MANGLMYYMCCLIILTLFTDQGDGRWKKKDRENFQRDMEDFMKISEQIKYDIRAFSNEYADERVEKDNNIDKIHQQYAKYTSARDIETKTKDEYHTKKSELPKPLYTSYGNLTNNIPNDKRDFTLKEHKTEDAISNIHVNFKNNIDGPKNEINPSNSKWPKFEDILLAMGIRYDWKNDRWIKVKEKIKDYHINKAGQIKYNHADFQTKHKFSYKVVKLNRSKSRRNVVIAVSAVR